MPAVAQCCRLATAAGCVAPRSEPGKLLQHVHEQGSEGFEEVAQPRGSGWRAADGRPCLSWRRGWPRGAAQGSDVRRAGPGASEEDPGAVHWIFKNKDHGKTAAAASLGLIALWDVEGGLPQIDKFLYSKDPHVVAGARPAPRPRARRPVPRRCPPAIG